MRHIIPICLTVWIAGAVMGGCSAVGVLASTDNGPAQKAFIVTAGIGITVQIISLTIAVMLR